MNHKQFMQDVKEYRQRSGHEVNYYHGGAEIPADHYTGIKNSHKGSLAKDKMRDLLSKSDKKSKKHGLSLTSPNDFM